MFINFQLHTLDPPPPTLYFHFLSFFLSLSLSLSLSRCFSVLPFVSIFNIYVCMYIRLYLSFGYHWPSFSLCVDVPHPQTWSCKHICNPCVLLCSPLCRFCPILCKFYPNIATGFKPIPLSLTSSSYFQTWTLRSLVPSQSLASFVCFNSKAAHFTVSVVHQLIYS